VLNGHTDMYHISHTATGFSIFGNGVDEWVTNVERLQFTNGIVALDINGDAGQAYRLYQAAFNRVPDVGGLGYQTNALDTGLTLTQVASNFIASPEFQRTYGNVDDTQFVTLLYQNVLHRAPDAGGLQFHLDEMHVQGQSRADVLVHFSESPENQANVIGQIQDGMFMLNPG
jgi:serralysin